MDVCSILSNDHCISPLELVWSGNELQWQHFRLDVVPAFHVSADKLPCELRHSEVTVHDLCVVPKWTASLMNKQYEQEAFQLGFSSTEKDLFYSMPIALHQGYKLAKVAVHDCMVIDDVPAKDYISASMLKTCAFECFADMEDYCEKLQSVQRESTPTRDVFADELQPATDVIKWADKIFAKLEDCIVKKRLQSFFLHGCNLIGNRTEDYKPLLYTRLCRALLTSPSDNVTPWTRLIKAMADQLCKPGHLRRNIFTQEIQLLREMGLDKNYRCENGCNLFYFVLDNYLVQGTYDLLEWGTSVLNVDSRGTSAINLAEKRGLMDIVNTIGAVHVEQQQKHQLGFDADTFVALSKSGNILLAEKLFPPKLHKLLLLPDGRCIEKWTRPWPQHVRDWRSRKIFSSRGDIILQHCSASTYVYIDDGEDLQLESEWNQEGELIQCLPQSRLAYRVKKEGGWEIEVREGDGGRKRRLVPPTGKHWGAELSVSGVGSKMVVLDAAGTDTPAYTLDIFLPENLRQRTTHEYDARSYVCCSKGRIFVAVRGTARGASVNIHRWSGHHLQMLYLDQLQLSNFIEAIEVSHDGRRLIMAEPEGSGNVSSLHVYQLFNEFEDEAEVEEEGSQYGEASFSAEGESKPVRVGEYEFEETHQSKLGQGSFGTVWLGKHSQTHKLVAVKKVFMNKTSKELGVREVNVMQNCNHKNIVKLYDYVMDGEWVFLVMEYCGNGDLNKFMKDQQRVVSISDRLGFMKDVTSAVKYIHGENILHRDIKSGNILVRGSRRCVLADLGLSRNITGSANTLTMTGVGTPVWMAPEVICKRYGPPADVFSLGLVLLAIINHQQGLGLKAHTEEENKPLCYWMDANRSLSSLDDASDDTVTRAVKALVLKMVCYEPRKRITITPAYDEILQIIAHAPQ